VRKLILFMATTVDGFVATADGGLWAAFPWPAEMQEYADDFYRSVDTAVYGRQTYDTIVPWWRDVAEGRHPGDVEVTDREVELAEILQRIETYVFSRTLAVPGRTPSCAATRCGRAFLAPGRRPARRGSRRPRGRRERVGEQSAQLVGGE
jgi:dihydrofolate reductase